MRKHIVILLILFAACNEEEELQYNVDLLTDVYWGIPSVKAEGSEPYVEKGSPTIFYKNGIVMFGPHEDYWKTYDAKSLLIERSTELWQIVALTDSSFHVSKITYPNGEFIVECVYYPE